MPRCLLCLPVFLACAALALAQEKSPDPAPTAPPHQESIVSRVGGIFDGDLPALDVPGTMKLLLRPHFGDILHRDYMRVDSGFRWALGDNFDASVAGTVFFNHGLGDEDSGAGIGRIRLGSKYLIPRWPYPDYETSISLGVLAPVGHPPVDMTDGYYHVTPSIMFQRPSRRNPHLTVFAGVGVDLLDKSSIPGEFGTNQPHDNSMGLTVGGVYDLGQLKWTLTAVYATTALIDSSSDHFFYLQPGLQWYVPSRYTFNSRTQWIVGFGLNTSWGPDGFDIGTSARLRAEITFRQVMDKLRNRGKPKPVVAP